MKVRACEVLLGSMATFAQNLRAGKYAARRDVAPRDTGGSTGVGDGQRKERVAREGVGTRYFAGVHVWLAGKASGIDDEIGFDLAENGEQAIVARVIGFAP